MKLVENDLTSKRNNKNHNNYNTEKYGSESDEYDEKNTKQPYKKGMYHNNGRRPQKIDTEENECRFVSVEEYDELSKLCDTLLSQQEQLQMELKSQASILKV